MTTISFNLSFCLLLDKRFLISRSLGFSERFNKLGGTLVTGHQSLLLGVFKEGGFLVFSLGPNPPKLLERKSVEIL